MLDLQMKPNMLPSSSPRLISSTRPNIESTTPTYSSSYEQYLRLPELSELWSSKDFPEWKSEPVVKPALQALEITFRLISLVLSDPRPYSDTREWTRRLDALCYHQIEIISSFLECPDNTVGIPIADLSSNRGVLARGKSSQEVWRISGSNDTIVTHTSESSLLPRLAAWDKSSDTATKISLEIESLLYRCPFTLGLGEPNLSSKPSLEYDLIVRPEALHALKKRNCSHYPKNQEEDVLFAIHHVLECWLSACKELLREIVGKIERKEWDEAANDCWLLERIWKLLSEVEDLHVMMDPDDFLRLKSELDIQSSPGYCFRSSALLDVTNTSKNLRHNVPKILGVEVDPNGGPRVQEAAMRLFHSSKRGERGDSGRLHLLQALQAIEAAVKRFFFGYQQLITTVVGSLEATGNRGMMGVESSLDLLTQMFMEPPYFPSLDAAKTFLGELWQSQQRSFNGLDKSCSLKQ